MKAEKYQAMEKALLALEYWFDTDKEIIDAMSPDERAVHIRLHDMIKSALKG
jgi:hypothetical protein